MRIYIADTVLKSIYILSHKYKNDSRTILLLLSIILLLINIHIRIYRNLTINVKPYIHYKTKHIYIFMIFML